MPAFASAATLDWILASDEPAARWVVLTQLLDRGPDDAEVQGAHLSVLADPGTHALIDRLGDWDRPEPVGGHNSAGYAPNLLGLIADMGVRFGDDSRVDAAVESLLHHHDGAGRLASPAIIARIGPEPVLSSLLCDNHAIVETLIRFGFADHPTVRRALDRMALDSAPTSQGTGWPCIPSNGFRGPGRTGDVCPQVTLEALRALARVPADRRPMARADTLAAARTVLRVWTGRRVAKPYMFGHGIAFKTVKWPPFWYGTLGLLDTIGRYPELWRPDDPAVEAADRRAVAELIACLVAYNLDSDGRLTPRSCYRGFEQFSFGQKRRPSPFATARVLAVLRPFEGVNAEADAVDVTALASSKGGGGLAIGPRAPH